ncbi:MAG: cation transporter, partial [Eggerthellaceae bacterium]|nr:cation transporter [Eggerthellaceae bacterium]
NYVVLIIGIILEGFSFTVALRDVNRSREGKPLFEYIRDSKSPTKFTVLLEDTAAELGMVIALVGIFFSLKLGIPQLDSIASIVIGALMAAIAVLLLRETRSLLIGEGLTRDEIEDVVFIVEQDPAVIKCGRVLSMYMGPNDMLLNLDVTFDDELDEGDVLQAIDRIEEELIADYPQCSSIFVEAESLNQVYRQRHDRRKAFEAEGEDEEERERERERERELERERAKKKAAKKKAKAKAAKKKAKAKKKKKKAKEAAAAVAAAQARQGLRPDVHLQAQKELLAAHAAAERAAAIQDILYHALGVQPEEMESDSDDWPDDEEHAIVHQSLPVQQVEESDEAHEQAAHVLEQQ